MTYNLRLNREAFEARKLRAFKKYHITNYELGYNGDYHFVRMKINGQEVLVNFPYRSDDGQGGMVQWSVIWEDAEDYYGNKAGMLKRYPELRWLF